LTRVVRTGGVRCGSAGDGAVCLRTCGHSATSRCRHVIHIGLWITIRQASGFTVERLRIGSRSCESPESCSVLHRAVHAHRVRLCIALRVDNSVRYGGYPL
jgi:hypothetical protein